MRKNPRRTNFLEKYQQIINGYNEEKDRLTIELTFEALLHFVAELDDEEKRAMREGLDEESLALFDLLLKENLSTHERNRLKQVAKELLDRLKTEKLNITNWDKTETNKANVQSFIYNYLYDEKSGLPNSYTQTEIKEKSSQVFSYIYQHYSNINQSVSP
jgi:type I restriction enzyme R subunit